MKKVTYAQAIKEAIDEEMARDEKVIFLGEDIEIIGGNFKATPGLFEKYGQMRVRNIYRSWFGSSFKRFKTNCRNYVQ